MQTQNKLLGDLARLTSGTMGMFAGLKAEIEAVARQQIQRLLGDMELVSREEFDAVKAMAAKARTEQEEIAGRLAALEAAIDPRSKSTRSAGAATASKATAKSAGRRSAGPRRTRRSDKT